MTPRRLECVVFVLFLATLPLIDTVTTSPRSSARVSSDEEPDDLFTDPPWTDKRIAEEMLRKYRFPNSNTNISVSVSVTIEKIDSQIDDLCHLQLLVKQKWMEPQLAYKNLRDSIHPIKIRNVNYIWNPQLAIEGIQESQMVGKDDVLLYSNGIVEYMYRKKIDLPAEHEMWSFPFDKRNCSLNFGNEDVRASWTYLSGAHVSEHESPWKVVESSKLGKKLSVNLRRSLSTWLWSLYIPTTILVFCSWIPLWLTSESQTSRSVLNATAFFTIFIIVLINLKEIPRTSYLKAVDIWCMIVCVFPLLALIQSTMVSSAAYKKRWQQILKTDDNEEKTRWLNETPYYAQLPAQRPKSCAKIMDYIFRVALPLTFCTAVCLYMITFIIPYSR